MYNAGSVTGGIANPSRYIDLSSSTRKSTSTQYKAWEYKQIFKNYFQLGCRVIEVQVCETLLYSLINTWRFFFFKKCSILILHLIIVCNNTPGNLTAKKSMGLHLQPTPLINCSSPKQNCKSIVYEVGLTYCYSLGPKPIILGIVIIALAASITTRYECFQTYYSGTRTSLFNRQVYRLFKKIWIAIYC